jgi:membrane associated rhomboid family serine protease
MLPLRDTVRTRTFPIGNWALIAANVLVFVFETSLPPAALNRLFAGFALIPGQLRLDDPASWLTLFTSAFLHGGWFHLISNMWTLYIFGDNVEDRMGSGRYLVFYLLAAVAAGLTQVYFTGAGGAGIPTVGASGAIAGVLGAYFILYPTGRVITLIPLFFLPWFVEIPAFIFLGIWVVTQFFSGLASLGGAGDVSGIAWWAHLGGFAFGMVAVLLFIRRARQAVRWYRDEYWPY